jgi:hypothetical protein
MTAKPSDIVPANFQALKRTYGILAYVTAEERKRVMAMSPADRKAEIKRIEARVGKGKRA